MVGIGIFGRIVQVSVMLLKDEDDDFVDDGIVEGEVIGDFVIDFLCEVDWKLKIVMVLVLLVECVKLEIIEFIFVSIVKVEEELVVMGEIEQFFVVEFIVIDVLVFLMMMMEDVVDVDVVEDLNFDVEWWELIVVLILDVEECDVDDFVDEWVVVVWFFVKVCIENGVDCFVMLLFVQVFVEKEILIVFSFEDCFVVLQFVRIVLCMDVMFIFKCFDDLGEFFWELVDFFIVDWLFDLYWVVKFELEGVWSYFLYVVFGWCINIGDGWCVCECKVLLVWIVVLLVGGVWFVFVLLCKGGVGKMIIMVFFGMVLVDVREDCVIVVDVNFDWGILVEWIVWFYYSKFVWDLVWIYDDVKGYYDILVIVVRDVMWLDVFVFDVDLCIVEVFSDSDYCDVVDVVVYYYLLVLIDMGIGIVYFVMLVMLDFVDQIVIVFGFSVDEVCLVFEMFMWLEINGYVEQVCEVIVVFNQFMFGILLVCLNEFQVYFVICVCSVVCVLYDLQIVGGGMIVFVNLLFEMWVVVCEFVVLFVEGLWVRVV